MMTLMGPGWIQLHLSMEICHPSYSFNLDPVTLTFIELMVSYSVLTSTINAVDLINLLHCREASMGGGGGGGHLHSMNVQRDNIAAFRLHVQ